MLRTNSVSRSRWMRPRRGLPWVLLLALAVVAGRLHAAEDARQLSLADGQLTMPLPSSWKKVPPRNRIIEHEYAAPADAKGDDPIARITIMRAGGSLDANIERWYAQFSQPDGGSTKERAKVEKFEVSGMPVHWVEIAGTFKESMGGGPFAPGRIVERPNYRMIGVILETKNRGTYFFKITGPDKLVADLADEFKKSLMQIKPQ